VSRIALSDYEADAAARLPAAAHAYIAGGAADELRLAANVAAWRARELLPRVLRPAGERDPSVEVLGRRWAHPVAVAPTAFQRMAHPEGEREMARGAERALAPMCIPTLATTAPVDVIAAAPQGEYWFQLYVLRDRGRTWELINQARESGCTALVVTVDLPVMGVRGRERRHPATAPADVPSLAGRVSGPATPERLTQEIDPNLSWEDIARFASDGGLPVLVKGILSPLDAQLAIEHGAAGIIVSNHGGRQLDTAIATARALPPIVEAAGDRLEVLIDGGIRRGTDVAKALALGARAVLVGRPALWGLAADGADGVAQVLELILDEFDRALALLGVPRARDLDATVMAP
jgi:4-hydroxymandelate oxidase